jgi:pantothenate kinase
MELDRTPEASPSRSPYLEAPCELPCATRLAELAERARALAAREPRTLLGVTGAPGAGKSTLAAALAELIGEVARVVSMDGFHLARSRLVELGRLTRMGAIDTFDADGFLALLRRLHAPGGEVVYAPELRREIEEPTAGAVAVEPGVRLVIVDGNYLLVPRPPWQELRALFDEVWYVEVDERVRLANLVARHRAFGKTEEEARRWALGSDQHNAELVEATRPFADLVVRLEAIPAA